MIPWHKKDWGDDVIVPGERIGGFVLGKQPTDMLPEGSSASLADWSGRHNVGVEIDEDEGLVDATTGDPRFRTREGFGVGTDWPSIVAAWGEPAQRRALEGGEYFDFKVRYPTRGIDFAIKSDKVLYVGVNPPDPESVNEGFRPEF